MPSAPLITDDAVVLGLLAATLGVIFVAARSQRPALQRFFRVVPTLVLAYFVPAIYNSIGLVDGDASRLYFVASRYLLPAVLVLLTVAIDIPGVLRLGPKALILFATGTLGVILGGPIALLAMRAIDPAVVSGDVWRGFTAVAGSWIGGSANQAAMKSVFEIPDDLFGTMVAVDITIGSLWMAVLLFIAAKAPRLDAAIGADTSALASLRTEMEAFERANARVPGLTDLMAIMGLAFGLTGLSHLLATPFAAWIERTAPALERYSLTSSFFWLVVLATTLGLAASFTPARRLEGVGASKLGQALLYILVATIGMQMNLGAVFTNPGLFVVGALWIAVHAALLVAVTLVLRAPMFYLAVGSQANIGGAASAPIVASAFHPSLAPVGVLLAVLGYALGTYGAWLTGQLMRIVAP